MLSIESIYSCFLCFLLRGFGLSCGSIIDRFFLFCRPDDLVNVKSFRHFG